MSAPIIEAGRQLLAIPEQHPVLQEFPWMAGVLAAKVEWWEEKVHTFAHEDGYKSLNDILHLGWGEFREALAAKSETQLSELGDITVFIAAAISRDMMLGMKSGGAVIAEELALVRYVDTELHVLFGEDEFVAGVKHMIDSVFEKIDNNFHPALNPPLPDSASRQQVATIYSVAYQSSRYLRKKVAGPAYDEVTGLPHEWHSVYSSNGSTPQHLQHVHDEVLHLMREMKDVYSSTFGLDGVEVLMGYWEVVAPGMITALQS